MVDQFQPCFTHNFPVGLRRIILPLVTVEWSKASSWSRVSMVTRREPKLLDTILADFGVAGLVTNVVCYWKWPIENSLMYQTYRWIKIVIFQGFLYVYQRVQSVLPPSKFGWTEQDNVGHRGKEWKAHWHLFGRNLWSSGSCCGSWFGLSLRSSWIVLGMEEFLCYPMNVWLFD